MPRLWVKPKGISDSIDVKTADFIMDTVVYCSAHVIVPERFDPLSAGTVCSAEGGRQGSPQRSAGESGQRREYVETRV